MAKIEKYIYISGALTKLKRREQLKKFYEKIGKVCIKFGFSVYFRACEYPQASSWGMKQAEKKPTPAGNPQSLGCWGRIHLPHLRTDPVKYPDISPREVWLIDYKLIKNASWVIAYVGQPSLGVGTELEIARGHNVPCLLLYQENNRVSRLARGNPAVREQIVFKDFEDCLKKLEDFLKKKGGADELSQKD